MNERPINSGGATICTQAFGSPGDPAVLLIMGLMASMLWWPEAFCERLVRAGRFVIRYDNRDTGRSTSYEPGHPGYSVDDMARDAVAVLDGYGIERAHVVGMSGGGMIGQLVALDYPERVASLTAISTTPIGDVGRELPDSDPAYLEYSARFEDLDWSDGLRRSRRCSSATPRRSRARDTRSTKRRRARSSKPISRAPPTRRAS